MPTYAVVIPAYNEASHLPATLAAVGEAMRQIPQHGVLIVVDNNSTDATAAVAKAHGATVVFEPHNQISRARNAGARAAIWSQPFCPWLSAAFASSLLTVSLSLA